VTTQFRQPNEDALGRKPPTRSGTLATPPSPAKQDANWGRNYLLHGVLLQGRGTPRPQTGDVLPVRERRPDALRVRVLALERKRPVVLSNYGPLLGNNSQARKRMQRARLNVTWRPPYGEHRTLQTDECVARSQLRSSQRSERFRAPTLLR